MGFKYGTKTTNGGSPQEKKKKIIIIKQTHPSHTSLMMADRGFFCGERSGTGIRPQLQPEAGKTGRRRLAPPSGEEEDVQPKTHTRAALPDNKIASLCQFLSK